MNCRFLSALLRILMAVPASFLERTKCTKTVVWTGILVAGHVFDSNENGGFAKRITPGLVDEARDRRLFGIYFQSAYAPLPHPSPRPKKKRSKKRRQQKSTPMVLSENSLISVINDPWYISHEKTIYNWGQLMLYTVTVFKSLINLRLSKVMLYIFYRFFDMHTLSPDICYQQSVAFSTNGILQHMR